MKFDRQLNIQNHLEKTSCFLFGPRQTGKSTLIEDALRKAFIFDLLSRKTFQQLSANPDLLQEWILAQTQKIIVIDEIQKLPELLDVIQSLIRKLPEHRFLLTGSSARRLKRDGVNLLGGRAAELRLYPLVLKETGEEVSLNDAVQWGMLPSVVISTDKRLTLESYLSMYLDQEIRAESLTRSIDAFSRFLEVAALCNTQQVNFATLASDVGKSEKTVASWFSILEDTLIGRLLPCFQQTQKRKAMSWHKFFYFDCGVANAILDRWTLHPKSPEFGAALENLVFTHLEATCSYAHSGYKLFYWRAQSKEEVDFIVTKDRKPIAAIEVKNTENPTQEDLKGLRAFAEDYPTVEKILLCKVIHKSRKEDGMWVYPVDEFLKNLDKRSLDANLKF